MAARYLDHLVALRAQLQEGLGLDVEPGQVAIDNRLPDHAERRLGPEVVLVVEAVHHLHHVVGGQAGILDVRHLVAAAVLHALVGDEAVGLGVVVKLGAGIGVGDRYLDSLAVQRLGEVDGVADRLLGLARQAEDEVAVDGEAEVVAVLGKVARALDGGALLDVLQDLRIAGLEAHDQQPAAGFPHGLQRVVVGGDARGAAPGQAQRLELCA